MSEKKTTKKLCVFFIMMLFLLSSTIVYGGEFNTTPSQDETIVTVEQAQKAVIAKLHECQKTDFSIGEVNEIYNDQETLLCYVFHLAPQGYVVVSASTKLPPVLAYSFISNFHGLTNANPLYQMLRSDVTVRLENIRNLPSEVLFDRVYEWNAMITGSSSYQKTFEQWPPEGTTPTGGWLLTNWHQTAPYNNFCPLDLVNNGRSVAGCPAVAMAQILDYHKTTNNVTFTDTDDYYHNWGGNQYWIDNDYIPYDFPSFPSLNSYLTTLQYNYDNQIPLTNNDKAALTFACGVAAKQVYSKGGSGTFNVNQAFNAYQRFNCTTSLLIRNTNPMLYPRLSNNMKEAMPAHLAVVDTGWTMGHNLVVDGYNTNDYYHLNFGWGGSNNGWYLLPDEIPMGLTVIEGVIIDILKEDTGIPQLSGQGTLQWINVTPNNKVEGTFLVSNIGEPGSHLDWLVYQWPSWGSWTFTPSSGINLKPEDEPTTVTVSVVAPNEEDKLYTGNIKLVNVENINQYVLIPVSLQTGKKTGPDLSCEGVLSWSSIRIGATVTGTFTVENIGKNFSNLSWEIIQWPDWGTWTFTPLSGENLTPEDGPCTIEVSVVAPKKRNTEFTGEVRIVNTQNISDMEILPVFLATPYRFSHPFFELLYSLLQWFLGEFLIR